MVLVELMEVRYVDKLLALNFNILVDPDVWI